MEIVRTISKVMALPLLAVLLLYQRTLSPDHGWFKPFHPYGYCKFYPSCSEYSVIVLRQQGLMGILKIIKRLIRCRPGVAPAVDQP